MLLKRQLRFNFPINTPCIDILPRVDKCRSQSDKATTVCAIFWNGMFGAQNINSISSFSFALPIGTENIGCYLSYLPVTFT